MAIPGRDEPTGSPWAVVMANLPGTGGIVQSSDTNGAGRARRFYLVRISP